jgi:glycosyltransferase involved in cell wall biosynthesis
MNNSQVLVSICVPIYKVEDYIERCAVSLFEQTYENIEYVFVNDCTPDRSWEILDEVIKRFPNRISRVIRTTHDTNRGLAAVRNTAANHASGDYLMWVDSDDWLERDAVSKCVETLVKCDYDLVYFDVKVYNKGSYDYYRIPTNIGKEELLKKMLSGAVRTSIYGALIKRSLYTDNGLTCKEGVNNSEDYQVAPKLLFYAHNIKSLGIVLYNYERRNELSMTLRFAEKNSNQNWESIEIISSFFKQYAPNYIPYIEKRKLFACYGDIKSCLLTGEHQDFYNDVVIKRLDSVDRQYWKMFPFGKRVLFYLRNKQMAKLYLFTVVNTYSYLRKIKYH